MNEQKKQLRRAYRERGRALDTSYRKCADRAVCEAVISSAQWHRAQGVFLFISMWAEPDTAPLFKAAFAAGKRVYVPLCSADRVMKAVRIHSLAELAPGTFGIPEPLSDAAEAVPGDIDLAVVPCVTVTRDGARLGHGAGFYDRFLSLHRCETLCLCYAAMLAENLPMEKNDIRMDAVVTEHGVISS